jgi:hypothetical protein
MSYLTRGIAAAKLLVKAKGPTIMVVTGVASMGAAVIAGGKATLKVEDVMAKHTPDLDKIAQGEALTLKNYTKDDARSDRFKVYAAVAVDLGKVYAVPAVLFIGGAGLVFGGHNIMLKRNATLAIAFTAVKNQFDRYRQRVVAEQGHEADQRFMNGYVVKEVIDGETGQVAMITTRDWDESALDPYNRVFEQGATTQWEPDLSVNRTFIEQQQRFANQLLGLNGILYLSDVYKSLGFPETDISRITGWKVKKNPDGSRDIPFVDFGLNKPHPDDWKYNQEKAVYLDINCQGLIVGGKVQKIIEAAR